MIPVKVWDGLENPSSWQQEPGGLRARCRCRPRGRARGDAAVPEWLQQLSWLAATVPTAWLLPDTQYLSSMSRVLLAGWI